MSKDDALRLARNSLCDVDNQLFDEGKRTPSHVEQAIAAIDAALAEPVVSDGWQPIETAPKDSRARLIYCPQDFNIFAATWDNHHQAWCIYGGDSRISRIIRDSPTHWMPYPAAPSAQEQAS